MIAYIIRRLLLMIPTLLLVTLIVFFSVRFIPGDVVEQMVAEMASESGLGVELTVERIRHKLGLDVPIHVQYVRWLSGVLRGDLGKSLWTGRPVTEEIIHSLPVSCELGLMAIISALLIALPIGVYSGIRQDTAGDYIGRSFAIVCISLPHFWIATMVIVYPSIWWGWTIAVKYVPLFQDMGENLVQFIIPALILGMVLSGTTMRMTRTMMLEVLRNDYIRTAWSKGLKERNVIMRHAMKNAMIPVITIVGIMLRRVLEGSIIIETIFCLPGIGRLLMDSLNTRDYPIISGLNLLMAAFVLVMNLVVDLAYANLDPRVRYK